MNIFNNNNKKCKQIIRINILAHLEVPNINKAFISKSIFIVCIYLAFLVSVSCAESSTSPTEIKTHKKEVPPISITTLQTLKSEIAKNLVAGPKNTNSIKKSLELLTNTAKSLVSKQKVSAFKLVCLFL